MVASTVSHARYRGGPDYYMERARTFELRAPSFEGAAQRNVRSNPEVAVLPRPPAAQQFPPRASSRQSRQPTRITPASSPSYLSYSSSTLPTKLPPVTSSQVVVLAASSDVAPLPCPVPASAAVPRPHLPLRKRSAKQLRLHNIQRHVTSEYSREAPPIQSPTTIDAPSVSSPHPKAISPKETIRDGEPSPDVEGANVLPAVTWLRARGMTTVSQGSPIVPSRELKQSSSIPDLPSFRANQRNMITSAYRPGRGPNSRDTSSSYRSPLASPWKDSEQVRTSFRSALANGPLLMNGEARSSFRSAYTNGSYLTYASSGFVDASETERSSVMTRASSASDWIVKMKQQGMEDEGMSVDDAISLYAAGFEDDELERKLDQGIEDIESFMSAPPLKKEISQPPTTLTGPDDTQSHRQSSSTVSSTEMFSERMQHPVPSAANPLPALPSQTRPGQAPVPATSPRGEWLDLSSLPELPLATSGRGRRRSVPTVKLNSAELIPRDRYGFKKATQYATVEQYDLWNFQYTDYLQRRRRKWNALMTTWGLTKDHPIRFPPMSDKVKRYIRKGIPPDWRGAAWFWYAGGPSRIAQNPGLYAKLCQDADAGQLSDTDREMIERDLNRTFPDNIKFKPDPAPPLAHDAGSETSPSPTDAEVPIVKSLRRVLQAFAVHNPNIGYCQSLNFLSGLLLLFLKEDEEKAFHLLDIMTSVHLPGTHAKVLETNVDVGVLMSCIRDSMPAVWAKIDDIDEGRGQISTNRLPTVSLATTAWFMSCYIGTLPIESVLRVWDSFFYEGSKTLFRIALAIFKTGESEIRNVNEHMEVFQVVQIIPRKLLDANALMESCFKRRNGFGHLSQETIDGRRRERRLAMQQDRSRNNNGQLDPLFDTDSVNEPVSRVNGLKRMASRVRMRGNKSVPRKGTPSRDGV